MKFKKMVLMSAPLALLASISPVALIASCASDKNDNNQSVDLTTIANQATFSVNPTLLNKYADEIALSDLQWDQAQMHPDVSIKFDHLKPDRELGLITFDVTFSYQKENVEKTNNQISGFKTDKPVDPQLLVDREIQRLNNLNQKQQLVKNEAVRLIDLETWKQNPNGFLKQLTNLIPNGYTYLVSEFDFQQSGQSATVDFEITVTYDRASSSTKLQATVPINSEPVKPEPPSADQISIIEQRELARINHQWKLIQNRFSIQTLDKIEAQPNLMLKFLSQFVFQQYFQYHVDGLKIVRDDRANQATISFTIQARFWRKADALNAKPLVSTLHTYQVKTFDEKVVSTPAPTNPTNESWKISPLSDSIAFDFANDQSSFDENQLFIKRGKEIIFNEITTKQFLIQLIEKQKLVKIEGTLADDWNWNLYLDYLDSSDAIIAGQPLPTNFVLNIFIDYPNSQDLQAERLDFMVELNNLNLNESQIPTYNSQQEFDNFKTNFINQVKPKVELNLNQIVAINDDQVNQFAMLNENNFLNYTNQDFNALVGSVNNNVAIKARDVQINYLTNEIKFKWVLEGRGILGSHNWVDDEISTLKLTTGLQIDQSGFDFSQYQNYYQIDLNNFHKFNLNPKAIERDHLKEQLNKFNQNWTWAARELATFSWFTLDQAFGGQLGKVAMVIVDHQNKPISFDKLMTKYDQYKIITKAKLDFGPNGQKTFLPFIQVFGSAINLQSATYRTNDEITIEIDLKNLLDRWDPVQDATEILPGFGQGLTLGSGFGYQDTIEKWPPRFDIWRTQIGAYSFKIYHNQQLLDQVDNNHRFISFNIMGIYPYQDQVWPEPDREQDQWVSGSFWT